MLLRASRQKGKNWIKGKPGPRSLLEKLHLHSWLESGRATGNSSVPTRSRALMGGRLGTPSPWLGASGIQAKQGREQPCKGRTLQLWRMNPFLCQRL